MARRILFLSDTYPGSIHDKKICDEENLYDYPEDICLLQDSGFQGYFPQGITVYMPIKKIKGKELTIKQKIHNRAISSKRVKVEHAISGIKRSRIVKDKLRNWKRDFADFIYGNSMCLT